MFLLRDSRRKSRRARHPPQIARHGLLHRPRTRHPTCPLRHRPQLHPSGHRRRLRCQLRHAFQRHLQRATTAKRTRNPPRHQHSQRALPNRAAGRTLRLHLPRKTLRILLLQPTIEPTIVRTRKTVLQQRTRRNTHHPLPRQPHQRRTVQTLQEQPHLAQSLRRTQRLQQKLQHLRLPLRSTHTQRSQNTRSLARQLQKQVQPNLIPLPPQTTALPRVATRRRTHRPQPPPCSS